MPAAVGGALNAGAEPAGAAIGARELAHRYGDRTALDGVSFTIAAGEVFGFLGPNGAGKSTLFRILATLARPHAGRATVFGHDVVAQRREVRRAIGVVFQTPSTDVHLSVAENLHCQARLYGLDRRACERRSAHFAAALAFEDRLDDRVGTLSGGLRRRVEIAKALLHEPRLLLLDEPSSGLDPGARRDLRALLERLARDEGVTIALTTHFIEEAESCDRILLLDRGTIVAQGAPADLKRAIGGDVVTLTSPDPEALRSELAERFGVATELHEETVRFERPRAHEMVSGLAEALPGRISSVTVARPTLEDVFLQRTGHSLWEGEA
jgi:ABC-2 type transport system ATP-binding protein